MLLKFTNTDSSGDPTTATLAVTVDGTRYEIETNGSELVEVPDEAGEYMLESGYAVEEASGEQNEQEVSDAVETQEVDTVAEADAEAEAEAVVEPAVDIERESDSDDDNDSHEV